MCSCNDLLTAYLAIELSSLAFYILASFRKVSAYSVESGIKYFIVGAISSAFFLLGSSFIYGAIGSINFCDFRNLFEESYFNMNPENLLYKGDPIFKWISIVANLPIEDVLPCQEHILILLAQGELSYADTVSIEFFGIRFIEFGLTFILFSLFIKLALAPFHL